MSTPSKRQRRFAATDDDEFETKEEKKPYFPGPSSSSSSQFSPLQLLLSAPTLASSEYANAEEEAKIRNWFCVDTTFAKQTCMQRSLKDVENWTTQFSSGLEGGMTAAECKHSCGRPTTQTWASSSTMGTMRQTSGVSAVNSAILNSLIASMLPSTELSRILPTSRAVYAGINPLQQGQAYLESLLIGITAPKPGSYVNNRYYLRQILNFLRGQEQSVNKFLSYPLLVKYLPGIYSHSHDHSIFFELLNQLPRLEKLTVLAAVRGLTAREIKQLIEQGTFQFADHEIVNDIPVNRQLWKLRDAIFLDRIYDLKSVDWFLKLRLQEEQRANSNWPMRLGNFFTAFKRIARYAQHNVNPFVVELLYTFLDRGYYLPLEEWKSNNNLTDALIDPLTLAVDTKDQKLIDKVAENYESSTGLGRIVGLTQQLLPTTQPEYHTIVPGASTYADENEEQALEQARSRYSTLLALFKRIEHNLFTVG